MQASLGRASAARRALALWLLLCLAGAIPAVAGPGDRLERVRGRRSRVERRLAHVGRVGDHLSARIALLDRRRVAVEGRVRSLDRRISRLDATISRAERRLDATRRHLALVSQRLDRIGARLLEGQRLLANRAVQAYESGPTGALDTLLSSTDMSDLFDRVAYYQSALNADARLVSEVQALRDEVSSRRRRVELEKRQIASDRAALLRRRTAVAQARSSKAQALARREAAIATKKALFQDVRARKNQLQRMRARLVSESQRIEDVLAARAGTAAGATLQGTGQLAWPVAGPVTSGYGYRIHPIFGERRFHTGIDIGAPYGAAVWAADDGTVVFVGAISGYGNVVIIDHGGGLATTYNHLSASYVSLGERVVRGQRIAAVGCTGYCTGPHLHFEVRVDGHPVDPMPYLS